MTSQLKADKQLAQHLNDLVRAKNMRRHVETENDMKNTDQKHDALRLADWVDHEYDQFGNMSACATELRRQHARIAELEAELEAVGAGGVQPLRKDMVPLSDVLERLAQGFGRESAPVTTIRSHFAQNAAQAKQGEQANG